MTIEQALATLRQTQFRFAAEPETLARLGLARASWADVLEDKRALEQAGFQALYDGDFTQQIVRLQSDAINEERAAHA